MLDLLGQVYLHKFNAQELGFRKGEPGQAGRYVYISKKYTGYFPPLSESIKNDHIILDFIPPESDQIVLTNFVYHNDKIAENKEGGRNEFRLYFNFANDPQGEYYEPNDILAIRKYIYKDNVVYKAERLSPKLDPVKYRLAEELLRKYDDSRYHSHALVPSSRLDFINLTLPKDLDLEKKIVPNEVKKAVFDEPMIQERKEEYMVRKIRNVSFRDLVLYFYNYNCAITGKETVIEYQNLSNIQAAHIIAFASGGGDNPANGMPLNRDMHWAFDNGFITVSLDFKVKVHEKILGSTYLTQYNNQPLYLPDDTRARPNKDSIVWHNENVFGNFLKK